ncbi:xanthine dehydrogenase molybdopterin binding subunit [Labrys neptuniae]
MHKPVFAANRDQITGGVYQSSRHDSGHKHVAGDALYIDDMPEPAGLLHAALGLSHCAHGVIKELDLSAVKASPGVELVLTAADIPGVNDISPSNHHDDPVFAEGKVMFYGQPIFAVVARTRNEARLAAAKAKIVYDELPAHLDIPAARKNGMDYVAEPMSLNRGDLDSAMAASPRRIKGTMNLGGQEHFYLESHIALAVPGEDGDVTLYSSTQHPSEIQHAVAHVLDVPNNAITTEIRRMGGAFGGKETQGNIFAAIAALAAHHTGRAVKLRPDRDEDMVATGKRHDFVIDYEVGFDDEGHILAVDITFAARCGFSADLSGPVTDRALFHADNCYFYPAVRLNAQPWRTHTVSNTAFRGFGGPQGVIGAERLIEEVAYATGKDPLEIRKLNFYGEPGRDLTPYHQTVEQDLSAEIIAKLEASCDYQARRAEIRAENARENARGGIFRRGIALTPVKFGISFTNSWQNQAGALVNVYADGSVSVNHGGTEMGQGLYIKVAQVVAQAFQIDLDMVKITATTTAKVPNTSPTAASSGTDLNGMAALDACNNIKERMIAYAVDKHGVPADQVEFLPGRVRVGNREIEWPDFVKEVYSNRIQLSSSGFYRTPDIYWDRKAGRGRAFYYYSYGAAASEVTIDTLTGEYRVERVDILHDVGSSLNPAIDIGQIEGGFVQGMGWLTTEELWWDKKGQLRTHAPSTYKIPVASDRPRIFNIELLNKPNHMPSIHRSKAVGEPPLVLPISVLHALSDAVASVGDYKVFPDLDAPATPERVLFAVEALRAKVRERNGGHG